MPIHEPTGERIAREYRERTTTYDPADVDLQMLQSQWADGHGALEVRYRAGGSVKSVRGIDPRPPGVMQNDDVEGTVFGYGTKYVLTPDRALRTCPYKDSGQQLAAPDDILDITGVDFPTPAPVGGAVQEGVTATVFYRSNISGRVKTLDIDVDSFEGHASDFRIAGDEASGDRRFELQNGRERNLVRQGYHKRTLGKVVRVDFPKGHQFTVTLENLTDERAEYLLENNAIASKLSRLAVADTTGNDVELDVTHDGRIGE